MATAYCVRCKKNKEIRNPTRVSLKNGRKATKGSCPTCGGKVYRIGG